MVAIVSSSAAQSVEKRLDPMQATGLCIGLGVPYIISPEARQVEAREMPLDFTADCPVSPRTLALRDEHFIVTGFNSYFAQQLMLTSLTSVILPF